MDKKWTKNGQNNIVTGYWSKRIKKRQKICENGKKGDIKGDKKYINYKRSIKMEKKWT